MHPTLRRSGQIGLLATTLATCLVTGPAGAAPPEDHVCLSNVFPNANVNERYGITERLIGSPPLCLKAYAGESWVRITAPWVTTTSSGVQEFYDNFVQAEWVTDEGTDHEIRVTAGKESLLWEGPGGDGQIGTADDFKTPDGFPFISPVSPAVRPLSIGAHTNVIYVTLSAEACDGFDGGRCMGTEPNESEQYLFSKYYDRFSPAPPGYPTNPPANFQFRPASELPSQGN